MNKQKRKAIIAIVALVAGAILMVYATANPIEALYTDRVGFDNKAEYLEYKAKVLATMDAPYVLSYSVNALPANNSMRWTAVLEVGHTLPYGNEKARPDFRMIVPGALMILFSIIMGLPHMYKLVTRRIK